MEKFEPHASSIGKISANLMSMLAYLLSVFFTLPGLVAAAIINSSEKYSGFVKFHSQQALLLCVIKLIFWGSLGRSFGLVQLAVSAVAVLGAVKAYKWKTWRIPIIGNYAFRLSAKSKVLYKGGPEIPPQAVQQIGGNDEKHYNEASDDKQEKSYADDNINNSESTNETVFEDKKQKAKKEENEQTSYSSVNEQLPEGMRDPPSKRHE